MKNWPRSFSIVLISSFLFSCDTDSNDPCDDVDPFPIAAAIVGIDSAKHLISKGESGDNIIYREVVDIETEVPANEYLLSVGAAFVETNSDVRCRGTGVASESLVDRIEIFSDADLTVDLPAGTSLGESFRFVFDSLFNASDEGISQIHASALSEQNTLTLDDYVRLAVAQNDPVPLVVALLLDVPIETVRAHTFTINYMLRNGDMFTRATAPIRLGPPSR